MAPVDPGSDNETFFVTISIIVSVAAFVTICPRVYYKCIHKPRAKRARALEKDIEQMFQVKGELRKKKASEKPGLANFSWRIMNGDVTVTETKESKSPESGIYDKSEDPTQPIAPSGTKSIDVQDLKKVEHKLQKMGIHVETNNHNNHKTPNTSSEKEDPSHISKTSSGQNQLSPADPASPASEPPDPGPRDATVAIERRSPRPGLPRRLSLQALRSRSSSSGSGAAADGSKSSGRFFSSNSKKRKSSKGLLSQSENGWTRQAIVAEERDLEDRGHVEQSAGGDGVGLEDAADR